MLKRFYSYKLKDLFVGHILMAYDKKETADGSISYSCKFIGTKILCRKHAGKFKDPISEVKYKEGISLNLNDETFVSIIGRMDLICDLPETVYEQDFVTFSQIKEFNEKISKKEFNFKK